MCLTDYLQPYTLDKQVESKLKKLMKMTFRLKQNQSLNPSR